MLQVIEAIDGAISLNVCLVSGKSCRRKMGCPAHPVWAQAQQAMFGVLASVTIAELAARPPRASNEPGWDSALSALAMTSPVLR